MTVIIVTFNCRRWLVRSIESMLQQTYPHVDLVVADDASGDVDAELLDAYPDVTFVRFAENRGPFRGLRRLWTMAGTPLVAFQDADDWSTPHRIERQVDHLLVHDLDGCGCWIRAVDLNGDPVGYETVPANASAALREARCHPAFHPTMLYRTAVLDALVDFDDRRFGADTEFLYRACLSHRIGNVQGFGYGQTVRPSSLTQQPLSADVRADRRRYRAALEREAERIRTGCRLPPEPGTTLLGDALDAGYDVAFEWVRPARSGSLSHPQPSAPTPPQEVQQ